MPAAPSFQLTMRIGPTPGKALQLNLPEMILGRDIQVDLVIQDAEVSRRHARLTLQGNAYMIEDLGSTNGTFINGQRLTTPHVLQPGDLIMLGEKISLVYERVHYDPNATVASAAAAMRDMPAESPRPPADAIPQPQPQPVKVISAEQFSQPEPTSPPPQPVEQSRSKLPFVLGGCALLTLCCVATLLALWYIDANYLWCTVLPFLPGCP